MTRGALALALLTAPLAAQAQTTTLTLEEARAMRVPELAHRVLGMIGDSIREVRIDSDQAFWPKDEGRVLKTIYLASAPDRAGAPGLCAATVYEVQFEPAGTAGGDERIPVAVVRMFRKDSYKVVSAIDYPGGRIDDSTHVFRDEAICPGAGPVLWQRGPDRKPGFFSGSVGSPGNFSRRYELVRDEAWFVARALQGAQRWRGNIQCRGGGDSPVPAPWLCADPRPMLASGIFWNSGGSYEIDFCADQPRTLCMTARFGTGAAHRQVTMTVATATAAASNFHPVRVRALTLEGY